MTDLIVNTLKDKRTVETSIFICYIEKRLNDVLN